MFAFLVLAMSADATATTVAVDPDSVVRCVREDITGSVARTRRVCHTVGEWRRINRDSRAEADRVIIESTNKPSGG